MHYTGWMYADPICSMCIATMIFFSVWPLLRSSGCILLQRTPFELDDELEPLTRRVCLCKQGTAHCATLALNIWDAIAFGVYAPSLLLYKDI